MLENILEDNHPFYSQSATSAIKSLGARKSGLSGIEVLGRQKKFGPNRLPEKKADGWLVIFARQFASPLIYILLAAAAVIYAMGEPVDGSIIMAILIFNAVIGATQEGKAQNTLQALRKFTETKAVVLRDGREIIVGDYEVTFGDVVVLREGEKVPADCRIISANNLRIDEAAITGESEPVHKDCDKLPAKETAVADQRNMAFKGTNIVSGNGLAVVTAIGPRTYIGGIAGKIADAETEMPLKANIRYLSRLIIIAVGIASVGLFALGLASGNPAREMFATVVSLAVSIIPEGLPIVLTLVLATGVWRMSKRKVLVKKLQAVEALGQARIIAVDKTGTITKNELVVDSVFIGDKAYSITGVGYDPKGEVRLAGKRIEPAKHGHLAEVARLASFCAGAQLMFSEEDRVWRIAGDPTEAAILVLARKLGFDVEDMARRYPVSASLPFDYKLKYQASIRHVVGGLEMSVVGAPEVILGLCSKVFSEGKATAMTSVMKKKLEKTFHAMSRRGLRVVAVARDISHPEISETGEVKNLEFVGFLGMRDALRPEVAGAMKRARAAGIRVVMITGDHRDTAEAIAREAGICRRGCIVLTGEEIDRMSDRQLAARLGKAAVFARVNPVHKLRIVQAFRARGETVAMTGDGVNDAPSLAAADLGVGMGRIGTEVAKEASDIVLMDDNFGSIVSAVEEGRSIYKTIRKVILYLFSTGLGEFITIAAAVALGLPLPVLAVQIIWLNFVTDGFLVLALAMEPKERGLLNGNFPKPKKYIIDKLMAGRMGLMGLVMAVGTLWVFKDLAAVDLAKGMTMSLTVLAVFQWFNAWNCHSEDKSIFRSNPFSNKYLAGAMVVVIALQLLVVYNPLMQTVFRTVPLSAEDWLVIVPMAFSIIIVEEIRKLAYRRRSLLRGKSKRSK